MNEFIRISKKYVAPVIVGVIREFAKEYAREILREIAKDEPRTQAKQPKEEGEEPSSYVSHPETQPEIEPLHAKAPTVITVTENDLLTALDKPRSLDELAHSVKCPGHLLIAKLMQMEFAGHIKRLPGCMYAMCPGVQRKGKETLTFEIEPIFYRKEEVDRGVILGERDYSWSLKRQYTPCYAKSEEGYISELSPHKKGFTVYIPASNLSEQLMMQIFKRNRDEDGERLDVLITKKTAQYIECDVLKRVIEPKPKPKQMVIAPLTAEDIGEEVF